MGSLPGCVAAGFSAAPHTALTHCAAAFPEAGIVTAAVPAPLATIRLCRPAVGVDVLPPTVAPRSRRKSASHADAASLPPQLASRDSSAAPHMIIVTASNSGALRVFEQVGIAARIK